MNRFGIAGYQGVPIRQWLVFREPAIRTAQRQPAKRIRVIHAQYEAICDQLRPLRIIFASAGIDVQQLARNIRVEDITGLFVFHLLHTAQRTAVT